MTPTPSPRIGFISLGCPKALVDTEKILTRLRSEGYDLSDSYARSDLIVINTCGFIEEAIDESFDAITEALSHSERVVVTGCLGKRAAFVKARFPQLLAVTGPNDIDTLMQAIYQHLPHPAANASIMLPPEGIRLTPRHFAYVKISEGCSHRCRFCIIPQLRGPLVSRAAGDILDEAEALVNAGVSEILLVSQDTAAYGTDLKNKTQFRQTQPIGNNIVDLSKALSDFGVWIRLHYLYPYANLDNLVELMADDLILPYLDMPLQHASLDVLRNMRRPAATENVLERIKRWRSICPDISIRSTFITGFPGETEDDFKQLLDFLEEAQLDKVGCFTYSPVDGAEANELPNPVDADIAEARRQTLMQHQSRISKDRLSKMIGKTVEVVIDEIDGDVAIGRRKADAPDIDGVVYIADGAEFYPGDLVEVTIDRADDHDLYVDGPHLNDDDF